MAFFPAIGLGQAAGVLVGQARGAGRDEDVPVITRQALVLCFSWMIAMALLYVLAGGQLMRAFAGDTAESARIVDIGIVVMRFVAVYCLFDALNVILGFCLAAAGDTRWIARTFLLCSTAFLALLWTVALTAPHLAAEWILATGFIFTTALLWARRFRSGAWRSMRLLKGSAAG
jgi:MATE family multidrug resistance protein